MSWATDYLAKQRAEVIAQVTVAIDKREREAREQRKRDIEGYLANKRGLWFRNEAVLVENLRVLDTPDTDVPVPGGEPGEVETFSDRLLNYAHAEGLLWAGDNHEGVVLFVVLDETTSALFTPEQRAKHPEVRVFPACPGLALRDLSRCFHAAGLDLDAYEPTTSTPWVLTADMFEALTDPEVPDDEPDEDDVTEPAEDPLDIDEDAPAALAALETLYRRYVVLPSEHHYTAMVLWAAHTYVIDAFDTTPRLFLDSPVPGCGKTRVLDCLEYTARNPLMAFNASSAALIRTIDKGNRTILMDEIDTLYAKQTGTEDITAVVNAGYKRGATVPRCVGQGTEIEVAELSAFAPMALAGLYSNVPEAVRSRAVHFHMRKRRSTERVEPFRRRTFEAEAEPTRVFLENWADVAGPTLTDAYPELPAGVEDRPAEVWEPLVAVADAVGGDWPTRAREACTAFVFSRRPDAPSLGVEMLESIRRVIGSRDRIATVALISGIVAMDDASPWPESRGSLTAKELSKVLRPFDVYPKLYRDPNKGKPVRGYALDGDGGLREAFDRYLSDSTTEDVGD